LAFTGASNGNGYRQFRYNDRNNYAHRYAWERVNGPIPAGMTVDHLCRVRHCVEVTHMELVDGVTNYRRGVLSRTHCKRGHAYDLTSDKRECSICLDVARKRAESKRRKGGRVCTYDQAFVRSQIALVRTGELRIRDAANVIGCNPNYLGRRIWRETRKDVLARDQVCMRCGAPVELDVQHRIPRSSGGTGLPLISFGMANLVAMCRVCHGHVEGRERGEGYVHGWLVHRGTAPETVPLLTYRGWLMLTYAGWCEPAAVAVLPPVGAP